MGEAGARLTWGVERRLEFIEFRLFWEGGVNRADIEAGAAALQVELTEHIRVVLEAMQAAAAELGLAGSDEP